MNSQKKLATLLGCFTWSMRSHLNETKKPRLYIPKVTRPDRGFRLNIKCKAHRVVHFIHEYVDLLSDV